MLPAAVADIPADFSISVAVGRAGAGAEVTVGRAGPGQKQMIPVRGFLNFGTEPGTVGLYAAPAVNNGATVTVSYAGLKLTRVG